MNWRDAEVQRLRERIAALDSEVSVANDYADAAEARGDAYLGEVKRLEAEVQQLREAMRGVSYIAQTHRGNGERVYNILNLVDETRVERCGGSGVLPQGGHEGTTRYACPGCPDCTPDSEGEEWTAARRIHAGEECDVVELLDSCPRCYGEVSNPERFGLGQICDFCLGDEDVHVIRAHRIAQSLSLADRYRQERDEARAAMRRTNDFHASSMEAGEAREQRLEEALEQAREWFAQIMAVAVNDSALRAVQIAKRGHADARAALSPEEGEE